MSEEVSTLRLYLLRVTYFLNFAFLGFNVWPALINHAGTWDPLKGVAYSFWAALSTLSAFGVRYPLRMLPVLLMQLFYKTVWLIAVLLPLWSAGLSTSLAKTFVIGAVVDLIVIPWSYVLANYVKKPGDRWR